MKCLGCGSEIGWDGTGVLAYTCPCGATVFYDEGKSVSPPVSLILAFAGKRELSHIDYYLGKSDHTSLEKEKLYNLLREKGAIWSWECKGCKSRVIEKTVYEVANRLYRFRVHPTLRELIKDAIEKEEINQ